MSNKICDTCTGCGACYASCPKNCITMQQNRISERVPVIDKSKCSNCGICKQVCPQNNPIEPKYPSVCYVAWSKNEDDLKYSASGGVATVIARYQFQNDDLFYGCDYDDNLDLKHFGVTSEADIRKIESSKYSQSNAYDTFKLIKESLVKSKQKIVFIGTPCQVAGLKNFLRTDYDSLITIDLVCHGTPPNQYFKEYINTFGFNQAISKIRFRGEYDQQLTFWIDDRVVYRNHYKDDLYFSAFYKNKISMSTCYNCQYANKKRISDITLADFWGLGELRTIKKSSNRPSLVLLNTSNGQRYFDNIKPLLNYEQREVIEAIEGNGRLNNPPGKSFEAKAFQKVYRFSSFNKAVKTSEKLNDYYCKYQDKKTKVIKFKKRIKKSIRRRLGRL